MHARTLRVLAKCLALVLALAACGHTAIDAPKQGTPDDLWKEFFDRAQRLERSGYYPEAERDYERALDAARAFPPSDGRPLRTRMALANVLEVQGRDDAAERVYREAIEVERRASGGRSEGMGLALNALGVFYTGRGRYLEAAAVLQEAIDVRSQVLGPAHPLTGVSYHNLGEVYLLEGEHEAAEVLLKRALTAYTRAGPDFAGSIVLAQNRLARLYDATDRDEPAEQLYLHAIRYAAGTLGRTVELAVLSRDLADLYTRNARYAEAEALYRDSLKLFTSILGPGHIEVQATLLHYAGMLILDGRSEEAIGLRARAAEIGASR